MIDTFPSLPSPGSSLSVYSSIERYDPKAPRDFKPVAIGEYVIRRLPMRGTLHTRYYILFQGAVIGEQISFPNEDDCRYHHRRREPVAGQHRLSPTEKPFFKDVVLQGRIIAILENGAMDLPTLAKTLRMTASKLFQVLERMVDERRIFRRGTRHRYIYRAA